MQRNRKDDWDSIRNAAESGDLRAIPSDVYIRYYFSIRAIASDSAKATPMERQCNVFWGRTGSGKSRRAWEEAGMEAYPKDPRTKWWCGYKGQENVVIDEFRGGIDISHILRWLDRYPVSVETKGSSRPLMAKSIWITSNIPPIAWYPDVDKETLDALIRRLNIISFQ